MTVGNELLGRLDREEAFPLREAPPADRERYLACSSSISSLAYLIARARVNPKTIGSRLSICAFHPKRSDPKIVTMHPL